MSDYKEPFWQEAPQENNWGNDIQNIIGNGPNGGGGSSGGGGGGSGSAGTGGDIWYDNSIYGDWVEIPQDGEDVAEGENETLPQQYFWKALLSLTYKFKNPKILTNARKQILKHNGKILKKSSGTIALNVYASVGFDDSHIDCLLCECMIDGQIYNASETKKVSEIFFNNGFNGTCLLTIRIKWQAGHYPPEINSAKFKVVDWNGREYETGFFALNKEYGNVINISLNGNRLSVGNSNII